MSEQIHLVKSVCVSVCLSVNVLWKYKYIWSNLCVRVCVSPSMYFWKSNKAWTITFLFNIVLFTPQADLKVTDTQDMTLLTEKLKQNTVKETAWLQVTIKTTLVSRNTTVELLTRNHPLNQQVTLKQSRVLVTALN